MLHLLNITKGNDSFFRCRAEFPARIGEFSTSLVSSVQPMVPSLPEVIAQVPIIALLVCMRVLQRNFPDHSSCSPFSPFTPPLPILDSKFPSCCFRPNSYFSACPCHSETWVEWIVCFIFVLSLVSTVPISYLAQAFEPCTKHGA